MLSSLHTGIAMASRTFCKFFLQFIRFNQFHICSTQIKPGLLKWRDSLKVGDVTDFSSFMGAVIDDKAFARIKSYIDHARSSKNLEILGGGQYDDSQGYFVQPTIVEAKDPLDKIMTEEIFGPLLSIYVYKDKDLDKTLDLVGTSTKFALTGAIFAQDE